MTSRNPEHHYVALVPLPANLAIRYKDDVDGGTVDSPFGMWALRDDGHVELAG